MGHMNEARSDPHLHLTHYLTSQPFNADEIDKFASTRINKKKVEKALIIT
jgi:hypothetical protein